MDIMKKVKKVISWVLQVLMGLEFLIAGQAKFTMMEVWEKKFNSWGYPDNFYFLIGALEVTAGVLFFIPKLSGYSAFSMIVVILGAIATHIVHNESFTAPIIIMALLIVLFMLRKPKLLIFWS